MPFWRYIINDEKNAIAAVSVLAVAMFLTACGERALEPAESGEATPGESVEATPAEGRAANGEAVESSPGVQVEWLTDLHKALSEAREQDRPVLINITGSDWCPPCIFLKENVFETDRFKEYARENLVLLEVDFPRRTELSPEQRQHNQAIAQGYRAEAYPTLILANSEAREMKRMVGAEVDSPSAFIDWIEK